MNRDYTAELSEVADLLGYALEDHALNAAMFQRLLSRLKALEGRLRREIDAEERRGNPAEKMRAHARTLHEFHDDTIEAFKKLTPF